MRISGKAIATLAVGISYAAYQFGEYLYYNKFRDKVPSPAIGGLVYCDLLTASHSGIYVGAGDIVHLDGEGLIIKTSAENFIKRLGGWNPALSIFTFCKDGDPFGIEPVAEYADRQVGRQVDYNLATNNCHRFTASCLLRKQADSSYLSMDLIKSLKNIHDEVFGESIRQAWEWR